MNYSNNSYLTEDTLKFYNDLFKRLQDVKASEFGAMSIYDLEQAVKGWQATYLSSNAMSNNHTIGLFGVFTNYVKNTAQFSKEVGGTAMGMTATHIFNLNDLTKYNTKSTATNNRQDIRIPVEDGWDGNHCFVELLVPDSVINTLQTRIIDTWGSTGFTHPLLPSDDGGYGGGSGGFGNTDGSDHFVTQESGFFRKHALLFYTQYIANSNLTIRIAKQEKYIDIQANAGEFEGPFATAIDPEVLVRITYYRTGAQK